MSGREDRSAVDAELEHRRSVMSRMPFCPDHRDKVAGLPCRECEIERLTTELAERKTLPSWSDDGVEIRVTEPTASPDSRPGIQYRERDNSNGEWIDLDCYAEPIAAAIARRLVGEEFLRAKALTEVRQEWADEIASERRMIAERPEYAEKAAVFELQRQLAEQEALHKREVLSARIVELDSVLTVLNGAPGSIGLEIRRDALRAELAALEGGKP